MKRRALQLMAFSSGERFNGGFIRCQEIVRKLSSLDVEVEQIFVADHKFHAIANPSVIDEVDPNIVSDLACSTREYNLAAKISNGPDYILLEQPWLIKEALSIKKKFPQIKLIYSSHNIEWSLKKSILDKYGYKGKSQIINEIAKLEIEAVRNADWVIATTTSDADHMKKYFFCDEKKLIIAPNGTSYVRRTKYSQEERSFCLVVGSAHPPLIDGIRRYISDAAGWLPRDFDIYFAGSISYVDVGYWSAQYNRIRNSRVKLLGTKSAIELNELLDLATIIALPITYGGGSNLKTPEALATGRPVVATRVAMRGFEEFESAENVFVTDDLISFKMGIIKAASLKPSTIDRENSWKLQWSETLRKIETMLESSQ